MYTEATVQALDGLRDLSMVQWYVIPFLALAFYLYTHEMNKARLSGDWNAVYAGLTILGMDFINETWNGWVLHFSGHSAFWTTPGETALRLMVGWNIEIVFMFSILGIIYYNSLSPDYERNRILGLPEKWAVAIAYAGFCLVIECLLNIGGHLVWEYPWWELSFEGLWLIFLIGYFHFYVAAIIVITLKSHRAKMATVGGIWAVAVVANLAAAMAGWVY